MLQILKIKKLKKVKKEEAQEEEKDDRLTRNSRYEKIKQALDKQIIEKYEKDPEACKEFFIKFKKFLGNHYEWNYS